IYYGEEIGMTGDKPDEHIRTPMQWGMGAQAEFTTGKPWEAVNPGLETVNVAKEAADPGSLLNWYKKLIHLRNAHPALATGGTWMVETDKPEVVAFLRRRATRKAPDLGSAEKSGPKQSVDTVLVAINLSDHPIDGVTLSLGSSPLKSE